jgi:predicted dehydrogenase
MLGAISDVPSSNPTKRTLSAPFLLPSEYDLGAGSLEGPGANVARLYAAFARDLRDGTPGATAPDFAHALRLHRTLDGIAHAAASGVAQTLGQGR